MDFWEGLLSSGVRLSVPVGFAALGELISERAGVLNLGLEGYMSAGAFAGFTVAVVTGSSATGLATAVVAGMLASIVMAVLAVRIGAGQIVSGFAVLFGTLGVVDFLAAQRASERITIESMPLPARWSAPLLSDLPLVGEAFFSQNFFYWLLIAATVVIWWILNRSGLGLMLTAAGHDPAVVAAKGINPVRLRAAAVVASGGLAAVGGAALSMGAIGSFTPGQINGRGFVAIAVVILGRWRTFWVLAATTVFGLSESLQLRLQDHVNVPVQLLGAVPWLVVLAMLVFGARSAAAPQAIGLDYRPLEAGALEHRLRRLLQGASRPSTRTQPERSNP